MNSFVEKLLFYSHINGITAGVMHVLKSCALTARNSLTNFSTPQTINETFDFTFFKARYLKLKTIYTFCVYPASRFSTLIVMFIRLYFSHHFCKAYFEFRLFFIF